VYHFLLRQKVVHQPRPSCTTNRGHQPRPSCTARLLALAVALYASRLQIIGYCTNVLDGYTIDSSNAEHG